MRAALRRPERAGRLGRACVLQIGPSATPWPAAAVDLERNVQGRTSREVAGEARRVSQLDRWRIHLDCYE